MCKQTLLILALTGAVVFVAGCGPNGDMSIQDRRATINDMAQASLNEFYQAQPSLRNEVQNAQGYGVFSTANVSVIFATGGGGYGVVVNNATGERTYMRSGVGGLGIGLGAKDYRQLMVFYSDDALNQFVTGKWDWGGQAAAVAKGDDKGGGATVAGNVSQSIAIYTMTDTGLSAELMATGTNFWPVDELNQPSQQPLNQPGTNGDSQPYRQSQPSTNGNGDRPMYPEGEPINQNGQRQPYPSNGDQTYPPSGQFDQNSQTPSRPNQGNQQVY